MAQKARHGKCHQHRHTETHYHALTSIALGRFSASLHKCTGSSANDQAR